jgi:phosphopentomutase
MPNEVVQTQNIEARTITTVARGKFRDASIHIGSENSIVMRNFQRGIDAFVSVNISALPSKDMLNTNLEDFDLEKQELVEVIGESADVKLELRSMYR